VTVRRGSGVVRFTRQLSRANTAVNGMPRVHCVRCCTRVRSARIESHAFLYLDAVFGSASVNIITRESSLAQLQPNLPFPLNPRGTAGLKSRTLFKSRIIPSSFESARARPRTCMRACVLPTVWADILRNRDINVSAPSLDHLRAK